MAERLSIEEALKGVGGSTGPGAGGFELPAPPPGAGTLSIEQAYASATGRPLKPSETPATPTSTLPQANGFWSKVGRGLLTAGERAANFVERRGGEIIDFFRGEAKPNDTPGKFEQYASGEADLIPGAPGDTLSTKLAKGTGNLIADFVALRAHTMALRSLVALPEAAVDYFNTKKQRRMLEEAYIENDAKIAQKLHETTDPLMREHLIRYLKKDFDHLPTYWQPKALDITGTQNAGAYAEMFLFYLIFGQFGIAAPGLDKVTSEIFRGNIGKLKFFKQLLPYLGVAGAEFGLYGAAIEAQRKDATPGSITGAGAISAAVAPALLVGATAGAGGLLRKFAPGLAKAFGSYLAKNPKAQKELTDALELTARFPLRETDERFIANTNIFSRGKRITAVEATEPKLSPAEIARRGRLVREESEKVAKGFDVVSTPSGTVGTVTGVVEGSSRLTLRSFEEVIQSYGTSLKESERRVAEALRNARAGTPPANATAIERLGFTRRTAEEIAVLEKQALALERQRDLVSDLVARSKAVSDQPLEVIEQTLDDLQRSLAKLRRVELVIDSVGGALRTALRGAAIVLAGVWAVVFLLAAMYQVREFYTQGILSFAYLQTPLWVPGSFMVVGGLLLTLQCVALLLRLRGD